MPRNAVKQCNGGCPSGILLPCETPQKRESFWSSDGSAAVFLLRALPLKAPLQKHGLEGEIEAATEHSEVIFRPVNDTEAQVVSPSEVPRDPEF